VAVEVVHRHERQAARPGEALGSREPDEERPDQARPGRHGDAADVVQGRAGLLQGLAENRQHELEVPAGRDLGHDSPVLRMQVGLGGNDVRADLALAGDECGGGLVAGGLEREDHLSIMPGSRRMAAS
jgi:hypothetical protein